MSVLDPNDLDFFDELDKSLNKLGDTLSGIAKGFESVQNKVKGSSKEAFQELKKEVENASGSTENLSKKLSDLEKKYTSLQSKTNGYETQTKKLNEVIKKSEDELEKLRKEVDQLSKSQGDGTKSTKTYTKQTEQLLGRFVSLGAGIAIAKKGLDMFKEQVKLAFYASMEFETGMKQVEAITRATKSEILALTANANKLGASTEYTSIQIANLQKELGKLGFSATEITASTSAIVDLATATGEDLVSAGQVASATLRAFGMDASQMTRMVDVMSGSFVRSGLDLEKFRESMKLLAPIASKANIDLETTTAMLSRLADAGLSGSMAGTSLRNVISRLADPNSKLAKYLGHTVTNSEELIKAFRTMRDEGIGLAEVVELVDVRARPAFLTLLDQIDSVSSLSEEYRILEGEGARLASMMRDTLANDIEILNSAFDALRREDFSAFNGFLRTIIQGLTEVTEATRLWSRGLLDLGDVFGILDTKISRMMGLMTNISKSEIKLLQAKQLEQIQQLESSLDGIRQNAELASSETLSLVGEASKLQDIRRQEGKLSSEQEARLEVISGLLKEQFGEHVSIRNLEAERVVFTELITKNIESAEKSLETGLASIHKQSKEVQLQIRSEAERYENLDKSQKELIANGDKSSKQYWELNKQLWESNYALQELGKKHVLLNGFLTEMGSKWEEIKKAQQEVNEDSKPDRDDSWLKLQRQRAQFALENADTLLKKDKQSAEQSIKYAQDVVDKKEKLAKVDLQLELKRINDTISSEKTKATERIMAHEKYKNTVEKAERDMTLYIEGELQKRFDKENDHLTRIGELRSRGLREETELMMRETAELNRARVLELDRDLQEENQVFSLLHEFQIGKRRESSQKLLHIERQRLEEEKKLELSQLAWRKTQEMNSMKNSLEFRNATLESQQDMIQKMELAYQALGQNVEYTFETMHKALVFEFDQLGEEINFQLADIVAEGFELISMISSEFFSRRQEEYKRDLSNLSEWEKERTELAGDNEEARALIEREAEMRRKALLRRQAIDERKNALYTIKLNTAIAVARALASAEPPRNLIQAGIVGAKGLLEYTLVATRPLPAFAEGTDSSPHGKALVSEEGPELVRERSGKTWLTPNRPSIVDLKGGSQVVPHDKTMDILNRMALSDDNAVIIDRIMKNSNREQRKQENRDTDRLINAIMNAPKDNISITEKGIERFTTKRGSTVRILNKRYNFKR